MKTTKVEPINAVVKSLKAEVKGMTPIERGKTLAKATAKPEAPVVVKIVEVVKPAVKDVIPFGQRAKIVEKPVESQTKYERRAYMRNHCAEEVNENTVTHLTSHTTASLKERILADLQKLFASRAEPKSAEFTSRDVKEFYQLYGPAAGDGARAALRFLTKQGKMEIVPHEQGRRTTYSFKLLELTAPVPQEKTTA